jgi:hypothetical protein
MRTGNAIEKPEQASQKKVRAIEREKPMWYRVRRGR